MKTVSVLVFVIYLVIKTTKADEEKTIVEKNHDGKNRKERSSNFNESPNNWMFDEHQQSSSFLPRPSNIDDSSINRESDFFGVGGDFGQKIESKKLKPVLVNQVATVKEVANNVQEFDNSRFNGKAPLKPNFYKRKQLPNNSGSSSINSGSAPDLRNLLHGVDLEGIMAGKLPGAGGLPINPDLVRRFLSGGKDSGVMEDELKDLLFGNKQKDKKRKIKQKKTRTRMTTEIPSTSNTTAINKRREKIQINTIGKNLTPDLPFTPSPKAVIVDGDRAEYQDYDYKDYDMYSYDIKGLSNNHNNNNTDLVTDSSNDQFLPVAAQQRQRRPGRRRPNRIRPFRNRNPELHNIPGRIQENIPGRIQGNFPGQDGRKNQRFGANNPFTVFKGDEQEDNQQEGSFPGLTNAGFGVTPAFSRPRPFGGNSGGPSVDCDFYTDSLCLSVRSYPISQIMALLGANRRISDDMIADVTDQSADDLIDGVSSMQENRYTASHYFGNRREDSSSDGPRDFAQEGGFLCPSEIKYAKPKRGKTAQGTWKDIVNVNDYTQTLRMEKCLKPGGTCSYVSHHYKSQCSQVYNYHRLLSWDEERGLHMDIYKVPTCCSCHIMGYSYVYPPLKKPNTSPAFSNTSPSFSPPSSPSGSSPSISRPKPSRPSAPINNLIPDFNPQGELEAFMASIGSDFPFTKGFGKSRPAARPTRNQVSQRRPPGGGFQPIRADLRPPPLNNRRGDGFKPNGEPNIRRGDGFNQNGEPNSLDRRNGHNLDYESEDDSDESPLHKYESIPISATGKMGRKTLRRNLVKTRMSSQSPNRIGTAVPTNQKETSRVEDGSDTLEIEEAPSDTDTSDKEAGEDKNQVNYGYHPIIDFFRPYRFSSK